MHALLGENGAGKSTLVKIVAGVVEPDAGTVHLDGCEVSFADTAEAGRNGVAIVSQELNVFPDLDVLANLYPLREHRRGPLVDRASMSKQARPVLRDLGLDVSLRQPVADLTLAQRQLIEIAKALLTDPRVLILDEPTSALDPAAAEEVLAALQRLVHDLGVTVLLAEHRLERVIQYADRVVHVPGDGQALVVGDPAAVMATSPVAPPVVALGRLAGWSPLPLSVRDARRASGALRERLATCTVPRGTASAATGSPVAVARDLVVRYGDTVALRGLDLTVRSGEVVAVMGRNGAGKSTLLRCMVGLTAPTGGSVRVDSADPATLRPHDLVRRVGLVPQVPGDLLYADSVGEECTTADRDADVAPGTSASLLSRLAPDVDAGTHPRDLSEGQRLALALAVVLATRPPLLLLDEPTRGLDYGAKSRLTAVLRGLASDGHAVLLATHDVELAADLTDRTVVLAEGEVVADGATADVVTSSPVFAPQVAKILAPQPWLTVRQVAHAMEVA